MFVPLEDLDRAPEQLLRRQVVAGDLHVNVVAVRGGRNVEQEQEVYRPVSSDDGNGFAPAIFDGGGRDRSDELPDLGFCSWRLLSQLFRGCSSVR